MKSVYDGVLSKKFVSLRKRLMVEQVSTRKTPRRGGRLDPDGKEGVDNMRTIIDPEPAAEEEPNETVAAAEPLAAEDSNAKVDDVDVTAGQLSPDREISFEPVLATDDGAAVGIAREEDEGVSNMEQLEETTARDIRENEDEATVDVDDTPGSRAQVSVVFSALLWNIISFFFKKNLVRYVYIRFCTGLSLSCRFQRSRSVYVCF